MEIRPSAFDVSRVQYNQTYTGKFGLTVGTKGAQFQITRKTVLPGPDCQTKLPVGSFGGTGRVYWGQFMVRDFMINLMSQVGQLTIFSRHVCTRWHLHHLKCKTEHESPNSIFQSEYLRIILWGKYISYLSWSVILFSGISLSQLKISIQLAD